MCDIWKEKDKKDLAFDKIESILSKLNLNSIAISGGEPFLRKDLFKIYKTARTQNPGAFISISTNGILISEIINFVKKTNDNNLCISISYDGENSLREKDSEKKALQTIKKLRKINTKVVLKFTINKENISQIEKTAKLSSSLGAIFQLKPVENVKSYTNRINNLDPNFSNQEINKIKKQIKNIHTKDNFINSIPQFLDDKNSIDINCNAPLKNIFIMENGDVYTCLYEKSIGNILKQDITKIISSKNALDIKKKVMQKKCNKCMSYHGSYSSFQKTKKIILINPSYQPHWTIAEPIGLVQLASYLEYFNIQPKIIDLNVKEYEKQKLMHDISIIKPDAIGITAATRQILSAYNISNDIKQHFPNIPIIFGGVHPTLMPQEALENGKADYVVVGEGEQTIVELIDAIKNKKDHSKTKGIAYLKDKKLKITSKRNLIELDLLPFPNLNLINIEDYNDNIHIPQYSNQPTLNIMTSRGCMFNCYFCIVSQLYNRTIRFHSSDYLLNLIKWIKEKHNINCYHFHDEDIMLNPKVIEDFCNGLIKEKIDIKWTPLATTHNIVKNKNLIPIMKKAGCLAIELGIESGDPKVLEKIGKNNLQQIKQAYKLLEKNNIRPLMLFMSYLPGETIATPNLSYQLVKSLKGKNPWKKEDIMGHFANPDIQTKFFNEKEDLGLYLATSYNDHVWHSRINLLPNELIYDIPQQIPKKDFAKELKKFQKDLEFFAQSGFYLNSGTILRVCRTMEQFYSCIGYIYNYIDGKKRVIDIIDHIYLHLKQDSFQIVPQAIAALSMMGLVKSKN